MSVLKYHDKLKKLYRKLTKANLKGKFKKAQKIEYKIIKHIIKTKVK
jgi:hypothetical protein